MSQTEQLPELLTMPEAARRLTISKRTLYRMAKEGLVAIVQVSPRGMRIPTSEVQRLRTIRPADPASGEHAKSA